jgi:hypothetical protein
VHYFTTAQIGVDTSCRERMAEDGNVGEEDL